MSEGSAAARTLPAEEDDGRDGRGEKIDVPGTARPAAAGNSIQVIVRCRPFNKRGAYVIKFCLASTECCLASTVCGLPSFVRAQVKKRYVTVGQPRILNQSLLANSLCNQPTPAETAANAEQVVHMLDKKTFITNPKLMTGNGSMVKPRKFTFDHSLNS
jgi:hypothetical protein